jgi:hypothetical protein
MSAVFGKSCSGAYDSLDGAKDYPRECDIIESRLPHYEVPSLPKV